MNKEIKNKRKKERLLQERKKAKGKEGKEEGNQNE